MKKTTRQPKQATLTPMSLAEAVKALESGNLSGRDYDNAMHAAGIYREAARPLQEIKAELSTAEGERKKVLEHAERLAFFGYHSTETLKALHAAKTFEERETIRAGEVKAKEARERQRLKDLEVKTARELTARKAEDKRLTDAAREKAEREKHFQKATIQLADDISQFKTIKKKSDTKRARINRHNGRAGGREPKDPQDNIDAAVNAVRLRMKNNPSLGMKRACEYEIKAQGLSIKWEALRKHVNKPRRAV